MTSIKPVNFSVNVLGYLSHFLQLAELQSIYDPYIGYSFCTISVALLWTLKSTVLFLSEEAVNEVKRQAMSELQKAVSEAERKAHEMISTERAKMERTVAEAKRQAAEDALSVINQQEDSSEVTACTPTAHCYYISEQLHRSHTAQ